MLKDPVWLSEPHTACHFGTGACGITCVQQHAAGSDAGRSLQCFRVQLVQAPWGISAMCVVREGKGQTDEGKTRDQPHASGRTAHHHHAGHVTSWILRTIIIAAGHRSHGHFRLHGSRRLRNHGRKKRDGDNQRKECACDTAHTGNLTQTRCFYKWICRELQLGTGFGFVHRGTWCKWWGRSQTGQCSALSWRMPASGLCCTNRVMFGPPLPRADLSRDLCEGRAECGEAVQDRDPDLELSDLAVEVSGG